jgi:hypothetical protein
VNIIIKRNVTVNEIKEDRNNCPFNQRRQKDNLRA